MEKFMAMEKTVPAFVNWEEVFSTSNRGRKEVRYYLKRWDGTSDLAVVGKEKNFGQITKPASSCRYRYTIRYESNLPFEISSKLRYRRQVIDWLGSLVTDGSFSQPAQPKDTFLGAGYTLSLKLENAKDIHLHQPHNHTTEFLWVGSAWTCRKKRKHYEAYTRSGVSISVHNFVFVLAEDDRRLVAYVDDLYEDSRGCKTARVQWFHKVDEIDLALPHNYNDNELFFSLCLQDLSIECIDGLATVLSPEHYQNFLKANQHTKFDPFLCRNQFDDDTLKPFDITEVKGYWKQNIHEFMRLTLTPSNGTQLVINDTEGILVRPRKRLRRLVDTDICTTGSEIEVLSQDSGIRGAWFKAVAIKKRKDKVKVRYQDIKDAVDESINLEEWIVASRVAASDQLGIRLSGRMTIRPSRSSNCDVSSVDVGCVVDAWLHDGWWEGIVVRKESDDRIHVYLPGEKKISIVGCKDLRYSEEWLGDKWKQMKNRPDVLDFISSATETAKSHENISGHGDNRVENSENIGDHEEVPHNHCRKYLLDHLTWNWSMKKKRHLRNSSQRLHCDSYNNTLVELKRRMCDGFLMHSSMKTDHENCKFICDSSLFCRSVASPLTSLVMSR